MGFTNRIRSKSSSEPAKDLITTIVSRQQSSKKNTITIARTRGLKVLITIYLPLCSSFSSEVKSKNDTSKHTKRQLSDIVILLLTTAMTNAKLYARRNSRKNLERVRTPMNPINKPRSKHTYRLLVCYRYNTFIFTLTNKNLEYQRE